MNKEKSWHSDIMDAEDDSLEILAADIKELENDELTLQEAGFMEGYDDEVDEFDY